MTREALHRLVDELPEALLPEATRLLAELSGGDPVVRAFLAAAEVDEPLSRDDLEAIGIGEAELARGETIPWAVVQARVFGVR